jgi:hypothetical protein
MVLNNILWLFRVRGCRKSPGTFVQLCANIANLHVSPGKLFRSFDPGFPGAIILDVYHIFDVLRYRARGLAHEKHKFSLYSVLFRLFKALSPIYSSENGYPVMCIREIGCCSAKKSLILQNQCIFKKSESFGLINLHKQTVTDGLTDITPTTNPGIFRLVSGAIREICFGGIRRQSIFLG